MLFNLDILYQIMRWDHDLTLMFYEWTRYPIPLRDRTPSFIQYIVQTNRVDLVKETIQKIPLDPIDILYLFELSVVYSSVEVCRALCTHPFITADTMYTYCLYALRENMLPIAYLIVDEMPIEIEQENNVLLTTAIKYNRHAFVSHILPRLEHPSGDHNTPLLTAIRLKRHLAVDELLQHPRIKPHEPDNAPFRTALYCADYWCMNRLWKDPRIQQTLVLSYGERIAIRHM